MIRFYCFLFSFLFSIILSFAQDHVASATVQVQLPEVKDMDLLSTWHVGNREFNDIWGYVDSQGKEVAIIGSRSHFYFVDISNPTNPQMIDGFAGGNVSIWRDMKTYGQWAYGVCDNCSEGLSIFKMGDSPASNGVEFSRQDKSYFTAAHNIFVDELNGRLYIIGSNTQSGGVIILDIKTNPEFPILLAATNLTGGYMHDLYVRDNIGYANSGNRGLYVYDFSTPTNIQTLGSMTSYPQQGYNHAGWLNPAGDVLIMADETHNTSLKAVDVSDLTDIEVTSLFRSELLAPQVTGSIAHNPFVRDNYTIVSYYHDGVQIFDISNPANVEQVAWYDTFTSNTNYSGFSGCWGVYPYLPSGNIIGSDGASGLFVLKPTQINFTPIPPVTPPFAFYDDLPPCFETGVPVDLAVNTDGHTIKWFRNGSEINYTNTITATTEGTYQAVVFKGPHSFSLDPIEIVYGSVPSVEFNVPSEVSICTGEGVDIQVAAGADSYEWFRNGVSIASGVNTIGVEEAGIYTVTAANEGCEITSEEVVVSLVESPEAILNVTENQILCETESLLLESVGMGESYQWYDAVGPIDGATDAAYAVMIAGSYSVEISNGDCSIRSEETQVDFVGPPIVELNVSETVSLCAGETFVLETNSVADVYEWLLDGVVLQSSDANTFIVSESGEYTLSISSDYCAPVTESANFVFNALPNNEIQASNSNAICEGEVNTLTASASGDTYQWYRDGQIINGATQANFDAMESGMFTVEISSNGCVSVSESYDLEVTLQREISLSSPSELTFCAGESAQITTTGQADSYSWSKDGIALGVNSSGLTVMESGVYTVVAEYGNCTTAPLQTNVSVIELPILEIQNSDSFVLCGNESIDLNAVTNVFEFEWSLNGSAIGQYQSTLSVSVPGAYSFSSTNYICPGVSNTVVVTQGEIPAVNTTMPENFILCDGETYVFEEAAGYSNYQWFQNGMLIDGNENMLEVNTNGIYTVEVSSADGCKVTSAETSLLFNDAPNATLDTENEQAICEGSSILLEAPEVASSYTWTLNGVEISDAQTIEANEAGVYQLQAEGDGCTSLSQEINLSISALPNATLDMSTSQTICEGERLLLEAPMEVDGYVWLLNGAEVSNMSSLDAMEAGVYQLMVEENGCTNFSQEITIVVNENPIVTFDFSDQIIICEGDEYSTDLDLSYDTYQWYRNEMPFSNELNIDIAEEGAYYLEAVSNNCMGTSSVVAVEILALPNAELNFDDVVFICEGESEIITAASGADSYTWYQNGSVLTESTNELIVSDFGDYSVVVESQGCAAESDVVVVEVFATPESEIDGQVERELCAGESITLSSSSMSDDYTWYLDGVEVQSGTEAILSVTEAGAYTVQTGLSDCQTLSTAVQVTEVNLPNVSNLEQDVDLCPLETITVTGPEGLDEYTWIKDGSPLAVEGNEIVISEAGTYQLEISQGSCSALSNEFTVGYISGPDFDGFVTEIGLCEGEIATIMAPENMDSYLWIRNGNVITNDGDVLMTSELGTYQVEVRTNGCIVLSPEVTILANDTPSVFLTGFEEVVLCEGEELSMVATVEGVDSLFWYLNNELIATDVLELIATAPGIYYIEGKNANCSAVSNSFELIVNDLPIIEILTEEVSVCPGDLATLEVTDNELYEYVWYFNGSSLPLGSSPDIAVSETGTYYVEVVDMNTGCVNNSDDMLVSVYEVEVPSIDVVANVLTSSDAVSYQWFLNGEMVSGATNMIFEADATGNYSVGTVDANGCSAVSEEVFVELTSVQVVDGLSGFSIHPNPVIDQLNISLSTTNNLSLDIEMYNQLGQLILTKAISQQGEQLYSMDVSDLVSGVYFISVRDENGGVQTLKFVK